MSDSGPGGTAGSRGLLSRVVRQTGWSTLEKIANQGLRFAFLLVLARLLQPEAFGVLAEALVVTSLLGTGAALGLEPSLVQDDDVEGTHFSTAAWTSAGLALGLVLVSALVAPAAVWVFDTPELRAVLPAAAVGPAVSNAALAPRARLRRRLDFKPLCLASLAGTAVGGGVAVLLAQRGYGVWSLVAQLAVDSSVTAGWQWSVAGLSPWAEGFSRRRLRTLVTFGGPYTGEQFLNFVNRRADDFVIGVFLGDAALGFYRIAYSALKALTRVLSGSLNAVALPVFSRVASDRDRLGRHFLRATELAALAALPAAAGFAAVADLAVPAFYGAGWIPAVPAARVLSFVAFAHSVLLFSPTAMYALGRSDLQLRLTALYAGVNVVGFLIGVQWGIVGVAAAYALQNLLTAPVELGVLKGLVPYRISDYLRKFWRPAVATALMLAAVAGVRMALETGGGEELACAVAVGLLAYPLALLATGPGYILGLVRRLTASLKA